mmetsp:Transcript_103857/g.293728  ORF Transcript_103857/g.293728 Transcript_103857/m.293728 type:complete len:229 (+) Transcript_103857:801-1487(+)
MHTCGLTSGPSARQSDESTLACSARSMRPWATSRGDWPAPACGRTRSLSSRPTTAAPPRPAPSRAAATGRCGAGSAPSGRAARGAWPLSTERACRGARRTTGSCTPWTGSRRSPATAGHCRSMAWTSGRHSLVSGMLHGRSFSTVIQSSAGRPQGAGAGSLSWATRGPVAGCRPRTSATPWLRSSRQEAAPSTCRSQRCKAPSASTTSRLIPRSTTTWHGSAPTSWRL